MKILIVEDEKALCDSIASYLRQEDFICDSAGNYQQAMEKIESYDYDCILLDITLQDGNGLDILKELKRNNKSDGVLIISARNSLSDKISGLTLGADDYLPKPFHLSELAARVFAIIRRKHFDGNNLLSFQDLIIDTQAKAVRTSNREIDLTKKEYQLLLYFVYNK